jgi:hypothetical protein
MTKSTALFSSPSAHQWTLGAAIFLSIFMTLLSYMLPFASHQVDSRQKVQQIQVHMKDLLETLHAPPSAHIMTNFHWPKQQESEEMGLPVVDAWTSLWWFRKLHTHAVVTTSWLVLAPLQLTSAGGRHVYSRQWHKRLGYCFVACSVCIAIGLMEIIVKRKVYGEPHWMAMTINILKWIYFVASLVLALWWPRRKKQYSAEQRIQRHKVWIMRHVTMGYTVAFQRFLMFVVGPALHAMLWRRFLAEENNVNVDDTMDRAVPRMLTSLEMQQWYNVTSVVAMTIPPLLVEWVVIRRSWFDTLGSATALKHTTTSKLE